MAIERITAPYKQNTYVILIGSTKNADFALHLILASKQSTWVWKYSLQYGKISIDEYFWQYSPAGIYHTGDKLKIEIHEGAVKFYRNEECLGVAFSDPIFKNEKFKLRFQLKNRGDAIKIQ